MNYISINVDVDIDLDDYEDEIKQHFKCNPNSFGNYIDELEKELTLYKPEYWRTPQQILEDLKHLR